MTDSLQQAFAAASQLPIHDQDAIARWIMAELQAEAKWSELFNNSQDALSKRCASEALDEHSSGETLDWDRK